MNTEFIVGNVVRLNYGGPLMTVYSLSDSPIRDSVKCVWFDVNDHIHYEDFRPEVLQLVNLNEYEE